MYREKKPKIRLFVLDEIDLVHAALMGKIINSDYCLYTPHLIAHHEGTKHGFLGGVKNQEKHSATFKVDRLLDKFVVEFCAAIILQCGSAQESVTKTSIAMVRLATLTSLKFPCIVVQITC